MKLIAGTFVSVLFLLSTGIIEAQGRFDDLLYRIPASANSVMVIDVKAVHSSPLAVKEDWMSQHEASYVNKPIILPPESDRLIIASQMNPNRDFAQAWEGTVISLTEPLSMRSIARAEGGYVDEINGLPVAWTPSDAYFVSFGPKTLGVMYPAHRQAISRWVDFGRENRKVNVSTYLKEAVETVDGKKTQIVMALDFKDVVMPHKLQEALKESDLTRDNDAKQKQWARIISGIRGASLSVQIDDAIHGTLKIDFSEDTAPFGKDAKALVLNALGKFGVSIDEMEQWKASLHGYSIELKGDLSTSGIRKIFSLLELPSAKFSSLKGKSPAAEDDTQSVVKASQAYFSSVSTLLDDLRNEFKTNQDARRTMSSVYLERYGRRIDRLPILNVDEILLGYGTMVAETLRSTSVAAKTGGVNTGVRKSQNRGYGNYSYGYNGSGYYSGGRSMSSVRTQVGREEQGKSTKFRFNNWKEIEDETAAMRVAMTRKYKVEF